MLRALGGYLEEMYLLEWRQSDFFTLLADEAADKSGSENLVVLARWYTQGTVVERIVAVVKCQRMDANYLYQQVRDLVRKGADIKAL